MRQNIRKFDEIKSVTKQREDEVSKTINFFLFLMRMGSNEPLVNNKIFKTRKLIFLF